MKEQDLVRRIKEGDQTAFNWIYQRYYRLGINWICRNQGSTTEAQDIFQEAMIILWNRLQEDQFVLSCKISTYLYSICQNLWLKELRHKQRWSSAEGLEMVEIPAETSEKIHLALQSLPPSYRAILTYYYLENKDFEEITLLMGYQHPNTARMTKHRAVQKLRELYTRQDFLE